MAAAGLQFGAQSLIRMKTPAHFNYKEKLRDCQREMQPRVTQLQMNASFSSWKSAAGVVQKAAKPWREPW